MEFDEHEDPEEEIGIPATVNYEAALGSSGQTRTGSGGGDAAGRKGGGPYRYRECMKNHAVGIGRHAVDGCGEFMAAGEEGTIDALKCAACNCHRNFHRKEGEGEDLHQDHHHQQPAPHHHHHLAPFYRPAGYLHVIPPPPPHQRLLALPSTSREEEDVSNPSTSGGGGGSKKRSRTRFTQEQKEKMLAFSERVGWRVQKQDEAALQQFCTETGVQRQVLKVWMHNNKNTLGKKQS